MRFLTLQEKLIKSNQEFFNLSHIHSAVRQNNGNASKSALESDCKLLFFRLFFIMTFF